MQTSHSGAHNPNPNQQLYCPLLGSCTLGPSSPTFITPGTAARLPESPLKFLKLASPKPAESAFPVPSTLSQEDHNESSCLCTFPLAPSTSHQSWCFPVWSCVGCCGSSFWVTTIRYLFHGTCLLLSEPHPYPNNNEIKILKITPAPWDSSASWDPLASCTSWCSAQRDW